MGKRKRWSNNDRNLTSSVRKFTFETAHTKFPTCSAQFWQSLPPSPPDVVVVTTFRSYSFLQILFLLPFCTISVWCDRAVSRFFFHLCFLLHSHYSVFLYFSKKKKFQCPLDFSVSAFVWVSFASFCFCLPKPVFIRIINISSLYSSSGVGGAGCTIH